MSNALSVIFQSRTQSSTSTPAQPSPRTKPIPSTPLPASYRVLTSANGPRVSRSLELQYPPRGFRGSVFHGFFLGLPSSSKGENTSSKLIHRRSFRMSSGMPSKSGFRMSGFDGVVSMILKSPPPPIGG